MRRSRIVRQAVELAAELVAVGQAGERIEVGQAGELVAGAAGLGDVRADAAPAGRTALLIVQGLGRERPPMDLVPDLNRDLQIPKGLAHADGGGQARQSGAGLVVIRGQHTGQQLGERALQQHLGGHAKRLGQARGHVPQVPGGRDLPQPIRGVLFKITQQQVDQLFLAIGFGLGAQALDEHAAVGEHHPHHHHQIDRQQEQQGPAAHIGRAQQRHHTSQAEDAQVGQRSGGDRAERESAIANHAHGDGGNQHGAGVIGRGEHQQRHAGPDRGKQGHVPRDVPGGGPRGHASGAAPDHAAPQKAAGRQRQHHQNAPGRHPGGRGDAPEAPAQRHGVDGIAQRHQGQEAQQRLDLACAKVRRVGAIDRFMRHHVGQQHPQTVSPIFGLFIRQMGSPGHADSW